MYVSRRRRFRPGLLASLAVAMALPVAVAAPTATASTAVPAATTTTAAPAATCTAAQQKTTYTADQKNVLAQLGTLTTLRNDDDVAALAKKGWSVPSHMWVSFADIGVTFGRPIAVPGLPPDPTKPDLLMYAPSTSAANVTDPNGPDFPYTLAGWAYTQAYKLQASPSVMGDCYPRKTWFVHERGIHDFATWGFIPVPPTETFLGQADGNTMPLSFPAGLPHMRYWDIHVWKDGASTGVPSISIQRPAARGHIKGINPPGAFFYPPAA